VISNVATDRPDKPEEGAEDEEEKPSEWTDEERPTVSPPFDPVAFARRMAGEPSAREEPGTPSDPHTKKTPAGGFRPPAPTYTDSEVLEEARKKSVELAARRTTPTGALSLANARIPSNLPPAPGETDPPSSRPLEAVDREWAAIEDATRPPPAGQNPEDFDVPSHRAPALEAEAPPTEQEMNDRVSLGDYTGALATAEKLLQIEPENAAVAACADNCRTVLRQMYTARIGPLDRVPVVMVPREQLRWLSIDHRAGFVLSLVDGVSNLEMILDVSGMPELDALRILCELAQQRIISIR
jgi:hypothetical protein